MEKPAFLVRPEQLSAYSPALHSGTINRRLIGNETVGAKNMEIVLGEIESTGLAQTHYHDVAEQAFYLLEGKCLVELEGKSDEMKPGDIAFFTPGQRHKVIPVGGPIKILVIYSPPLGDTATSFKT
ncbi:cupin domain-containing protein [Chloroflexota bacterium]